MEEEKINIELFKDPLGAWYKKLSPFFEMEAGQKIYKFLKKRNREKHKIFPLADSTFRAFTLTDPMDIKCVIVGMSPYHTVGKNGRPHADGLAFSSKLTKEEPPSLKLFNDAIEDDMGKNTMERQTDLSYLAKQGVLLINTSLTTELGKPTIHLDKGLWDDFNTFLFTKVLDTHCGIPFILSGTHAHKLEKLLFSPMCHTVKKIEHPAFAARQNREWGHDSCFEWANKILTRNINEKIEWCYEDYMASIKPSEDIDDTPWD